MKTLIDPFPGSSSPISVRTSYNWFTRRSRAVTFPSLSILFVIHLATVPAVAATPSADEARQVILDKIAVESEGRIGMVSFEKTDGVQGEASGMIIYVMDFEVIIKMLADCKWASGFLSGDGSMSFHTYNLPTDVPATRALFEDLATGPGTKVLRGEQYKITGVISYLKKEKGWTVQQIALNRAVSVDGMKKSGPAEQNRIEKDAPRIEPDKEASATPNPTSSPARIRSAESNLQGNSANPPIAEQSTSNSGVAQPSQPEMLYNTGIIELVVAGFGENVIIEKIRSSKCNFDVRLNSLKELKSNNISDVIIQAMIATKMPATGTALTGTPDSNDPAAPHSAGIWLFQDDNGRRKMTQLELEPAVESSSGGYVGPWGIGKIGQTALMRNCCADLELSETRPVFYIYLRHQQNGDDLSAHEFSSARSPRDFTLAHFDIKDRRRVLEVGRQGAYGGSSGVDPKALREFTPEKVGDGIYKITFKNDLNVGQYCFCRALTQGAGEFYPFGISSVGSNANSAGGHDSDAGRLTRGLNGGNPGDVIQALQSLRTMNAREATPKIMPLLKNSDANVVCEACRTLAVLGDKDSIVSIEPLVKGPLDFVETEGSSWSVAARIRRNNLLKEVRKEAQDAIKTLQGL